MTPLLLTQVRLDPGAASTELLIEHGSISRIGPGPLPPAAETFDAAGRALLPGFVDAHTHACWAGSRIDEWVLSRAGVAYLDILARGGGIMSTVRAVRAASQHELEHELLRRLELCLRHGTTTIEVKSGYGLTPHDEIKMLRAITEAGRRWPGTVVPTACIGHAKDPDDPDPVRTALDEVLPAVTAEFPGITIDGYCERGAWSRDESLALIDAARAAGHPVRWHTDQFNDLGLIPQAVARGVLSLDHLEAAGPDHLRVLAESDAFGVMLPACGLHLDGRYADGRRFLDLGGRLVLATNLNPGSAPCASLALIAALGVRQLGLEIGEALDAITAAPARLLGLTDRGQIQPGARADLVLLHGPDPREVAYGLGHNPVAAVWVAGDRVV